VRITFLQKGGKGKKERSISSLKKREGKKGGALFISPSKRGGEREGREKKGGRHSPP